VSDRGNVRGAVILSRIDFIRRRWGDEGLERVLDRLPERDREMLAGTVIAAGWYGFDLAERLGQAIAAEANRGSAVYRELGAASAEDNLASTAQRSFLRAKTPHALLEQAPALHALYYDTGRSEYERRGESSAVVRTVDCASRSEADCATVCGWLEKAITMSAGRHPRVVEKSCSARGGAFCEYECTWE
jgi:hypothetical protein